MMQAGLDTTAKDKSAGIDQFEKDVQSDIKELTDDLTKLKVSKTSLFLVIIVFSARIQPDSNKATSTQVPKWKMLI